MADLEESQIEEDEMKRSERSQEKDSGTGVEKWVSYDTALEEHEAVMQREEERMAARLVEMNRDKTRDSVQEKDREFKWEEWDWDSEREGDGSTREVFEPRGSKGLECQKMGKRKEGKAAKMNKRKAEMNEWKVAKRGMRMVAKRDKRKMAKRGTREERKVKSPGGKRMDRMKAAMRFFGGKRMDRMKAAMRFFGGKRMDRMKAAMRFFGGKMKVPTKSKMMMRTGSKLRGRETLTCDKMEKAEIGLLMFGRMRKVRKEERWEKADNE